MTHTRLWQDICALMRFFLSPLNYQVRSSNQNGWRSFISEKVKHTHLHYSQVWPQASDIVPVNICNWKLLLMLWEYSKLHLSNKLLLPFSSFQPHNTSTLHFCWCLHYLLPDFPTKAAFKYLHIYGYYEKKTSYVHLHTVLPHSPPVDQ